MSWPTRGLARRGQVRLSTGPRTPRARTTARWGRTPAGQELLADPQGGRDRRRHVGDGFEQDLDEPDRHPRARLAEPAFPAARKHPLSARAAGAGALRRPWPASACIRRPPRRTSSPQPAPPDASAATLGAMDLHVIGCSASPGRRRRGRHPGPATFLLGARRRERRRRRLLDAGDEAIARPGGNVRGPAAPSRRTGWTSQPALNDGSSAAAAPRRP